MPMVLSSPLSSLSLWAARWKLQIEGVKALTLRYYSVLIKTQKNSYDRIETVIFDAILKNIKEP